MQSDAKKNADEERDEGISKCTNEDETHQEKKDQEKSEGEIHLHLRCTYIHSPLA
jgi:hypothetical protein